MSTLTPGGSPTDWGTHLAGPLFIGHGEDVPQTSPVLAYDVKAFGAVGNGVKDDTDAIAAAYAALTTGILFFPAGTYNTTRSLVPRTGTTIRGEGPSASIIAYAGSGVWLDLGATALADDVGVEDLSVECSGAALGAIWCGRTTQAYGANLIRLRWRLTNLYLHHAVLVVGSVGVSAMEYLNWTLTNVTINNFERSALWHQGGNSTQTRVRYQGFRFGPKWYNDVGGCQDTLLSCEMLGPTTTGSAGVDYGYTCEIDANFITCISALYESIPGSKTQGYLHLMSHSAGFAEYNGAFSAGATPDNTLVFDNGYNAPRFVGTYCPPGQPAITFGTTAGGGAKAIFLGCSTALNLLVAAQPITKSTVVGPTAEATWSLLSEGITLSTVDITAANGYVAVTDTTGGTAAPATGWRLFADVLGGKRRVIARFPTGANVVIATEP